MDHRPKRVKIIKCLEENIRENLFDLWLGKDFLDIAPKVQSVKEKIQKLDLLKIKNFCFLKDTVKRTDRLATD